MLLLAAADLLENHTVAARREPRAPSRVPPVLSVVLGFILGQHRAGSRNPVLRSRTCSRRRARQCGRRRARARVGLLGAKQASVVAETLGIPFASDRPSKSRSSKRAERLPAGASVGAAPTTLDRVEPSPAPAAERHQDPIACGKRALSTGSGARASCRGPTRRRHESHGAGVARDGHDGGGAPRKRIGAGIVGEEQRRRSRRLLDQRARFDAAIGRTSRRTVPPGVCSSLVTASRHDERAVVPGRRGSNAATCPVLGDTASGVPASAVASSGASAIPRLEAPPCPASSPGFADGACRGR